MSTDPAAPTALTAPEDGVDGADRVDPAELAELGERLQRAYGTLWLHRLKGDPYAALLCDVDEDPGPLKERVRAAGPLWRSGPGPWVTADPAVGAALLAHPGTGHEPLLPGEPARPSTAPLPVPDLGPLCARLLDAAGAEFDLVADVAEPLAAGALARACAVPEDEHGRFAEALADCGTALDAVVCPQRLATARRTGPALDVLRSLLGAAPGAPDPAAVVAGARTGADLVARTVLGARLPLPAGRAAATVDRALDTGPPVRIAPLVAHADIELAGARIAAGERLAVLLDDGPEPPVLRATAPLRRAMAESLLAALADRYTGLSPTAPAVRRPRAPLTRGPARVPLRATAAPGARRTGER
ncbi:hypothetical protein [Streptomyces showdoensis]|uniref:hypothetical protein n=1 Tax=Streptomyces showdoensis TaxID=68268 RepID=UPI00103ECE88|nr:hypothetical protein [Streptomyces showdoensis]